MIQLKERLDDLIEDEAVNIFLILQCQPIVLRKSLERQRRIYSSSQFLSAGFSQAYEVWLKRRPDVSESRGEIFPIQGSIKKF